MPTAQEFLQTMNEIKPSHDRQKCNECQIKHHCWTQQYTVCLAVIRAAEAFGVEVGNEG